MSANALVIILVSLFEIVAIIIAARLMVRSRVSFLSRVLWSVVLLVPFFGLLVFLFLYEEPEAHADNVPDTYHTGSSSPGNPCGHSGDGHGGH
jgi:hypothetical protein